MNRRAFLKAMPIAPVAAVAVLNSPSRGLACGGPVTLPVGTPILRGDYIKWRREDICRAFSVKPSDIAPVVVESRCADPEAVSRIEEALKRRTKGPRT